MAKSRIAEAYVQIVPRVDGVAGQLKTQLNTQMAVAGKTGGDTLARGISNGVGSKIKGYLAPIAATVVATFGAQAIAKGIGQSITLASDFAEQGAAVGQVFGKAAGDIQKFATQGATSLGQSKTQILEAAKSFGIYGKAAGMAGEDNAKFSTDLVKLATDLASFNNTSVDEAIFALGAGLRGESEPLRRYGVLLSDAELKARALEMGIYDGNGTLTAQQKILAANAAIFAQTSTQQGDFERTSAGLANQQRILTANVKNAGIAFGTLLLPAVTNLVTSLNENVVPVVTHVLDKFQEFADSGDFFGSMLTNIGDAASSWLDGGGITNLVSGFMDIRTKIITAIANSLPGVIETIGNVLVKAIPQIASSLLSMIPHLFQTAQVLFQAIITALQTVVPNLIQDVVDLLPKLVKTITGMLPTIINSALTMFMGLVQGLLKALPKLIVSLLDALPKIVQTLANMLPGLVAGAVQLFIGLIQGLVKIIPQLLNTLVTVVLPKLISTIVTLIPILIRAAVDLFLALVQGLSKVVPQLISAVVKLIPQIVSALIKAVPQLVDAGFQLVMGLVRGIVENGPRLITNAIKGMADLAINNFKALLGIQSPSKVFKEFGKNIIQGLVRGLSANGGDVEKTMDKVSKWISDKFEKGDLPAKAARAAKALVKAYRSELMKLEREHDKIVERLKKAQESLADKLKEKTDYVSGLAGNFGSTLEIDTSKADANTVAKLQNKVNEARAKYNELLKDSEASLTDIEDARLSLVDVEADLNAEQSKGTTFKGAVDQLKERIAKSKELKKVTDQLIELGLDKGLIKQIVESGAVDFGKSIIAGGKSAIEELNAFAKEADAQALALADTVGSLLFDEGINFAKGLVAEIKKQKSDIEKEMKDVAKEFGDELARVIKAGLGLIKDKKVTIEYDYVATGQPPAANPGQSGGGATSGGGGAALPWQMLATGGFVTRATPAIIGEAGPEVVYPLKDFERVMGLADEGRGNTVNYYAAPNQSLDSEQALFEAMRRAKVVVGW